MNGFRLIDVYSAEDAAALLAAGGGSPGTTLLKAGGVDVLDRMKEGLEAPERLINLRRITTGGMHEAREVKATALPPEVTRLLPGSQDGSDPVPRDCLRIGALTTLAVLTTMPIVNTRLPALGRAARGVATPQIRAMATVGGNLLQRPRCWYFRSAAFHCLKKGGDECFAQTGENEHHALFENKPCAAVLASGLATPLLALDAILEIQTAKGLRYQRIGAFFTSPGGAAGHAGDVTRENRLTSGEVLTNVWIPLPRAGEVNLYSKVKQKQSFDWPLGEVAIAGLRQGSAIIGGKIVLGAVAPVPWRAREAETLLAKLTTLDLESLRAVGRAAMVGAKPLAKNEYKIALCQGLVAETLAELLTGGA